MELQEILKKRQSIRHFKDVDVPREDLEKIIRNAGTAPSGKNIQNWHFVVIKNKSLINKIGDALIEKNEEISLITDKIDPEKGDKFRKFAKNFTLFFLKAPVLIVIYTTTYYPSGYHELVFIDASKEILDDIVLHRNPGMQSLGAAVENLTLSAIESGYGTCWITSANYAAEEIEQLLKKEIDFEKEGYFMGAMLSLGVPEDNPKSPGKKTFDDIYTLVE
ncbi:MAG: nitroreductase family protein [Eubacteriales bacterium]